MRGALPVVMAMLAIALPGTAQAARTWEAPVAARSGDGVGMVAPAAQFTSTGELVAAWSMRRPQNEWIPGDWGVSGRPLRVAVRPRGGSAFGAAQTLDDNAWPFVELAADGRGGAVLAWLDDDWRLKVSWRSAGGAFVAPRDVGHASNVDLAANGRGDAAVVFRGADAAPWMAYRPAGGEFGAPQPLAPGQVTTQRAFPDVGLTDDGRAMAVWQEESTGVLAVFAAQRSPGGAVSGPTRLSSPDRYGQHPQIAVGGQGHAMAAWTQATAPHSTGYVATARLNPGCCYLPPTPTSLSTVWFGARIVAVEGTGAVLSAFDLNRAMAVKQTHPHGLSVVGMDMASGATTHPVRLHPGYSGGNVVRANARGDVIAAIGYGGLLVSRRAPGGGFAAPVGVTCSGSTPRIDSVAVGPGGDAAVFLTPSVGGEAAHEAQLVEDRETREAGRDCRPPATEPRGRGRLALQARLPRGGRLVRGRWLEVRAFCGVACRIRARGTVRVAGRRRSVKALGLVVTTRQRAGTSTLRVRLTRKHRRAIVRALRRRKAVRARLHVRARGGGADRTVTFRVRLRR